MAAPKPVARARGLCRDALTGRTLTRVHHSEREGPRHSWGQGQLPPCVCPANLQAASRTLPTPPTRYARPPSALEISSGWSAELPRRKGPRESSPPGFGENHSQMRTAGGP